MEYHRKIGRIGQPATPSYYLTIPKELMRELGWHDGRRIIIRKVRGRKQLLLEAVTTLDEVKMTKTALDKRKSS